MTSMKVIESLVKKELREANKKHPAFHSAHEAYAVILEEVEEVKEELNKVEKTLPWIWNRVRRDLPIQTHELLDAKYSAKKLAAEAIQVAAMCQKMIDSCVLERR